MNAEPFVPAAVGPVQSNDRISAVDALRGFALFGILLMNITAFGMYIAAYDDPTVAGGATGINLWTWAVLHVVAEGKMRCIFSIVFGASMILLTSRAEGRGGAGAIADVYYRRLFWLMLIGILHAYLLWQGEILYPYALCGLLLFPLRKLSARSLLIIAGVIVVLMAGANIFRGLEVAKDGKKYVEIVALEKQGKPLTEDQKDTKKKWEEMLKFEKPTQEFLKKDAESWRSGFVGSLKERAKIVGRWHSSPYYGPGMFDMWSMMIIGMALMKLGILDGTWSWKFYAWTALIGYAVGLTVNSVTAANIMKSNFDMATRAFNGCVYDLGRLTVALAHIAVLLMLCKGGVIKWLTSSLAAAGQMAFSNYLMQSVICSTIFCGYGFAMYGRLERYQLYYVVAGVWLVELIWSPIWLRHFRFGPAEWVWRSLTYWKRQPFRMVQRAPVVIEPPPVEPLTPLAGEAAGS